MCYSAMVKQNAKELRTSLHTRIDLALIEDLFERRFKGENIYIPKGIEHNFEDPKTEQERNIKRLIDGFQKEEIERIESDLFALRKRLADSKRKFETKKTKTAEKDIGVCERKIERLKQKLENVSRTRKVETDDRIYPLSYTLVTIMKEGKRTLVPMRYHLRPSGKPKEIDRKLPTLYNARIDNLTGFWRPQFGKNHGIVVVTSFFENVKRHDYEKRELKKGEDSENMILQFKPDDVEEMIVPVIWDHWTSKEGESLYSFALITDEPPPEVSEAGHDRCPIDLAG